MLIAVFALASLSTALPAQAADYPGIGRQASPQEIAAWDIDVRPDLKGLPAGSGSVAQGQIIWEAQCASCHGVFGESNQFFTPLIGGTTQADIKSGRVARLTDNAYPARTTMMKLSSISTLWDYINRAMPWTQPKSLSTHEVYAVTAYMLNLADILPADYVLSDKNMADVQKRLPNRNGMTTQHALWPSRLGGQLKPDVKATACLMRCAGTPEIKSFLPDFARDAHGNLADQNRGVGAQIGAVTAAPSRAANSNKSGASAASALLSKHGCLACHGMAKTAVGPSFHDIFGKYKATDTAGVAEALAKRIRAGGVGVWGQIPMPAQTLPEADALSIGLWIAQGAKP